MTGKTKGLVWVLAAILLAAGLAVGLPHLARHTPWRMERWLAGVFDVMPRAAACRPPASQGGRAALDKLVRRLYPLYPDDAKMPLAIEVTHGNTINAFATLGGKIFVIDGLLAKAESPEELAGVLAHEIEHVRHRHIIQGLVTNLFTLGALSTAIPGDSAETSRMAYTLLQLKFSRDQEREADESGLERLKAAHVSSRGFEAFFKRAGSTASMSQILSSHPDDDSRAALAARFRDYPTEEILDRREWQALRAICADGRDDASSR